MPLSAPYVGPRGLDTGLHRTVAEIDNDQVSLLIFHPAPSHQVLKACVIRPARSVAQAPLALVKNGPVDSFQEIFIELVQVLIHRLIWTSAQEHGQSYLASLKLPFME